MMFNNQSLAVMSMYSLALAVSGKSVARTVRVI